MTDHCPLCRLPMRQPGRLVGACDADDQHFVFGVCVPCTTRLERLPENLQRRQLNLAIGQLAKHPYRYTLMFFPGQIEATLFCRLEADRLAALTIQAAR